MIEMLAARIAGSLKRSVPDHPSSVEVFTFAISMMLNLFFIVAATLGISLHTGRTGEIATILISFALLRQLTGGLHLKSNLQCVVVSTILFTGISLIAVGQMWIITATMAAVLIIFFIAPVGISQQSTIPSKYYPYMKLAAMLLVASNFLFLSPALALSFLAQSITLVLGKVVRS
ncbi:accessory regulator AgrB [Paenibacillus sp. P3E]|uniref:accessory gene regulator ArgB-like protein n=1 Tax=Paenibacillus sp. P3E TaxID=1349435 RepID=UPI000939F958|nr:accessory gene regulator B family protein [Paenibacillus sp. P3E]OKP84162.1 accessory regulator AgrB [Paenibacillus sp. P3E]